MSKKFTRRQALKVGGATVGAAVIAGALPHAAAQDVSDEEYVWLSANANLPLFVAHDHPALEQIGQELGVKVTIAGPNTVDVPGLVAAIEQVAARKPAGLMVVGWDPSALIPPINAAIEAGIPVVCVDADVPDSKRLSFIGTDWNDIGKEQAKAMITALDGKTGTVAMLGLKGIGIMETAFAAFKAELENAGCEVMDAFDDKGASDQAATIATNLIQTTPDLVGLAGFDSESGHGIGLALRETDKAGDIIGTCVDAEAPHLTLLKQGVLVACVGQKRELFTYYGVKALYDANHNQVQFTGDDEAAGVVPIPVTFSTGTYTVTADNVDIFLAGMDL